MKKATAIIIYGAICLAIGFFFGRSYINTEPKLEYIKGATITGSVSPTQFKPIKEEKPDIQYQDTGSIKYVNLPVDTAAIIADWELKRTYKLTAFDNKTQGKLELFPVIQYNRLTTLDYNFTPIQKQTNTYLQKVWHPFASGSYSTLGYIGVGGGVFYHNLGLEYQYQKSLGNQNNGHLFSVKYMMY